MQQSEIIRNVFNDIAERFAFMFSEDCEDKSDATVAGRFLKVVVQYSGHQDGTLEIVVASGVCPEIASNVLGLDFDEEVAEPEAMDVLKEFANLLCGHFLTAIFGDEVVFNLTIPDVECINGVTWKSFLEYENTLIFTLDDYPIAIRLNS